MEKTMTFNPRAIFQYGYFVNDLDASVKHWVEAFGAGPFTMVRHHRAEGYFRYRGGDVQADVSYAFGYCGDTQVQLIQQHDDQHSIYREMFADGTEGLHHVAILSADVARARADLEDSGLELAVEMWSGAHVVYLDGRKQLGFFVEIHGITPLILKVFDDMRDAHRDWDRTTPAMIEDVRYVMSPPIDGDR
jgi:hypothetical protein